MWRMTPGPSMSASTTRSPACEPPVRRALASAVRRCRRRPGSPVGFSNVTARESSVGSITAGFQSGRSSMRSRVRLDHRVVAVVDPRPIGRHLQLDRRESGTRWPRPAAWRSVVFGRRAVDRARMVEAGPAGPQRDGTAVDASTGSSTNSRMWTAGSSPRWRWGSTSPRCEPGHEPQAAVVDVGVVERHPRADGVVATGRRSQYASSWCHGVAAPMRGGLKIRWPQFSRSPRRRRGAGRRCAGRCGTSAVSRSSSMRRSGNSS